MWTFLKLLWWMHLVEWGINRFMELAYQVACGKGYEVAKCRRTTYCTKVWIFKEMVLHQRDVQSHKSRVLYTKTVIFKDFYLYNPK